MQRKVLIAVAMAAFLSACSGAEAPAVPQYDPPRNHSAKGAFIEAMRIDADENVEVGEPPKQLNAVNSAQFHAYNDRVLMKRHTKTALQGLRAIELGACEWAKSSKGDVPRWARKRVTPPPSAVYKCAYTVSFQLSPPIGDKYSEAGAGAFFKEGEKWAYMGKLPNPYN